jgi:hypothetical protein
MEGLLREGDFVDHYMSLRGHNGKISGGGQ